MSDVVVEDKEHWFEIKLPHEYDEYPHLSQWIEKGAVWLGALDNTCLPTCMRSIKRSQPPIRPAGLEKADWDTVQRWQADQFRFPPYQYASRFLFWKGICGDLLQLLKGNCSME